VKCIQRLKARRDLEDKRRKNEGREILEKFLKHEKLL
jgi:hypothetical protein